MCVIILIESKVDIMKLYKKEQQKAFTLIELLAVIIILAVIALITTPIVLNVVDNARKSAFESSTYGIINAVRLKSMENITNNEPLTSEYEFPNIEIEVGGEQPKGGIVKVDNEGKVAVAVHNGEWCATKTYSEGTLTLKDYVEGECIIQETIFDKTKALVYDFNNKCKTDGTTYQYMGGCYIKANRSTALQNHVWYNGFLWRIMGINSDGNIKLITDESATVIVYNEEDNTNFEDSYVDKWLNTYFYNRLSNKNNLKTDVIVPGTFCQGENTSLPPSRTDCTNGDIITRNVGLISMDEYDLAGDDASYLNNRQYFWTMTPNDNSNLWNVNLTGGYEKDVSSYTSGIRPVINVKPDTLITSGSGSLNDYYVLFEFKGNTNTEVKLVNAKVGEYVLLNNKRYRVVENGATTKLILDGYYQEEGSVYKMKYGSDGVFTDENRNQEDTTLQGIGYKLNTDVLDWLTEGTNKEKLKTMILPSTWYQNNFDFGYSYEVSLNGTTPTRTIENVKVGLIRIGEILSAQSYSILTNNGTELSNFTNTVDYWILTSSIYDTRAWYNTYEGDAYNSSTTSKTLGIRPVINISSDLNITSGNGTLGHEYVVEIK